jgi:hypothetical protein
MQLQENIKFLLSDLANHSSGVVLVHHTSGYCAPELKQDEELLLLSLLGKAGFYLLAESEQGWLFATSEAMQQLQAQPASGQQAGVLTSSGTAPAASGGGSSSSSAGAAAAAPSASTAASSTGAQPVVSGGDSSSSGSAVPCTPCKLEGLTVALGFVREPQLRDVGYEQHPHATPGDVQLVFGSSGAAGTARVDVKLHVCLKPSTSPGSNAVGAAAGPSPAHARMQTNNHVCCLMSPLQCFPPTKNGAPGLGQGL